jgi:diguanylate cyclase (GGDEF)-like protein
MAHRVNCFITAPAPITSISFHVEVSFHGRFQYIARKDAGIPIRLMNSRLPVIEFTPFEPVVLLDSPALWNKPKVGNKLNPAWLVEEFLVSKLLEIVRRSWDALHASACPQAQVYRQLGHELSRERLRRGTLLATFIIISLFLDTGVLLSTLVPRPLTDYIPGVLVGIVLQLASIWPNRRGRVEIAVGLYLSATVASCAVIFSMSPHDFVSACILIYGFYLSAVIQAGFLVEKRAPMVIAGISVIVIYSYIFMNARQYQLEHKFATFSLFTVAAFGAVVMITLALLTWVTAGDLEHAMTEADRAAEIEKLYGDLKDSHLALESRNQEINTQAQELADVNGTLLFTQEELQHTNRRLEALNRHLSALAAIDFMTGLANHRAFQQTLRSQVALATRYERSLSLMMIDVDRFKEYNDTFGHPAGDDVLRAIGQVLTDTLRASDLPARYGGEEFAVILPETDLKGAARLAERIRGVVDSYPFGSGRVTLSIGVAGLAPNSPSSESLLREADAALYRAKRQGRNCVAIAEEHCGDFAVHSEGDRPLDTNLRAAKSDNEPDLLMIHEILADTSSLSYSLDDILSEPSGPVLAGLLTALDLRDAETEGHSQRVARYAVKLGRALTQVYGHNDDEHEKTHLSEHELKDLAIGALLHDIGKMQIPDEILRKPGPLNFDEWEVMRRHTVIGARIVSDHPLLARGLPVVRSHHERWDGQGYPDRLAADTIPLMARIFAVCDTYEAMTTDQPYRRALSYSDARDEIARQSGSQFDPLVVEAFLEVPEQEWIEIAEGSTPLEELKAAA